MGYEELTIEGHSAVLGVFHSDKIIDKLPVLDNCQGGSVRIIVWEAKKHDTIVNYMTKERLDQMSGTGRHQGVIASTAAYKYAEVEDMLKTTGKKEEPLSLVLLDRIEDPHNLGAIIRTANLAGAHGVIIPKCRAVGLTVTVARTSAGTLNYTLVIKVANLMVTMEGLKKEGIWLVRADMGGEAMYRVNLEEPIGPVVSNEGEGVGKLVSKHCDVIASVPMKGDIDSLNASAAAGVSVYEIVRQRIMA